MNKKTVLLLVPFFVLTGLFGLAYFYFQSDMQIGQPKLYPSPKPTHPSSPSPTSPNTSPEQKNKPQPTLDENWQIYTSQRHSFQLAHPKKMEISLNPNQAVRLLLTGPSQAEDTELFDGILLVIQSGGYGTNSLKEFVELETEEIINGPTAASVSQITPVTINQITGYKFDTQGRSKGTYYYLKREGNKYLRIISIVRDPTDQGYRQTEEKIIETITLI